MKVEYKFYNHFDDYKDFNIRRHVAIDSYSLSELELLKYSWLVGLSFEKQNKITQEVIDWKNSIIKAFVDYSDGKVKIKNINLLETTEKGSIAYFLGMIFTYAYMCKEYKVKHLFHLTNKEIIVGKIGNKSPDLWGYVDDNESYLVEAKGSVKCTERFSEINDLKEADKQLNLIYAVKFHYNNNSKKKKFKTYSFKKLKRIIVGTHPIKNKVIRQEVIDPVNNGNEVIEINADQAIYYYYYNLMTFLVDQEEYTEALTYFNREYIVISINKYNYKIGLLKSVYKIMRNLFKKAGQPKNPEDIELFNEIQKANMITQKEIKNIDRNMSLGEDGIIIMKSEGK